MIVARHETGIIYSNQTNGVMCEHPELEGYLIPLPPPDADIFNPDGWCMNCNRRGPRDTAEEWGALADRVEAALQSLPEYPESPKHIRVLRNERNGEAWFHIEFDLGSRKSPRGVLTWESCD